MDLTNKLKLWLNNTSEENLNQNQNNSINNSDNTNDTNESEAVNETLNNQINLNHPLSFDQNGELKFFENNSLIVYVQKSMHQRRTKFRLQDSLFKIKIEQKNSNDHLLLKDLLDVFDVALKFVLQNIKTFFDSANHHIVYLTLYQDPMVNGLNTGILHFYSNRNYFPKCNVQSTQQQL